MTYAIYAVHAFRNSDLQLQEAARSDSEDVAKAIVDKLKKEKFTTADGKRLRRYASVFMREIKS